jgi:hypothetical protein
VSGNEAREHSNRPSQAACPCEAGMIRGRARHEHRSNGPSSAIIRTCGSKVSVWVRQALISMFLDKTGLLPVTPVGHKCATLAPLFLPKSSP